MESSPQAGKAAPPDHTCPGPGCTATVPYRMLACRKHWYQVSAPTRARVWDTWNSGRGRRTPEHLDAILDAINEMTA